MHYLLDSPLSFFVLLEQAIAAGADFLLSLSHFFFLTVLFPNFEDPFYVLKAHTVLYDLKEVSQP